MTRFNINESVRVRLTDVGRAILAQQAEDLRKSFPKLKPYVPKQEDAEGYVRFSMWSLMQELGPYVSMGTPLPFETEIILDEGAKA